MKPATRTYAKVYPQKRSDNGKMSFVVKWIPERGSPKRKVFNDASAAERHADHIENLYHKGMRIVGQLSIQELANVALMLAQIPQVPPHEIIQFYKQAHGLNGAVSLTVQLKHAAAQFLLSRDELKRRRPIADSHRRAIRQHTDRLTSIHGEREVTSLSVQELNDYITDHVPGAAKTQWNHMTTLKAMGRWMRTKKKWFPLSMPCPFEELEKPGWRATRKKEIYTPEELTRFLAFTPTKMLGFIVLGAFGGGMRAAERVRVKSENWEVEHKQLALPDEVTKNDKERIVDSEYIPNLADWVAILDLDAGEAFVNDRHHVYRETAKIAKASGVPWKYNGLRYSFISYHQWKFRKPHITAMLAGHGEDQEDKAYKKIKGVNDDSAAAYFAITPESVVAYCRENGVPEPEWANKI